MSKAFAFFQRVPARFASNLSGSPGLRWEDHVVDALMSETRLIVSQLHADPGAAPYPDDGKAARYDRRSATATDREIRQSEGAVRLANRSRRYRWRLPAQSDVAS